MTTSTDATLFFGWLVSEGAELPWREQGELLDDWYRVSKGYKPPFELFTEEGAWIGGEEAPLERAAAYFAAARAWDAEHPVPIEEVRHCSDAYTMYAVAVKGTVLTASRGDPEELDPAKLVVDPTAVAEAQNFSQEHGLPLVGAPKWWLVSWWG